MKQPQQNRGSRFYVYNQKPVERYLAKEAIIIIANIRDIPGLTFQETLKSLCEENSRTLSKEAQLALGKWKDTDTKSDLPKFLF